MKDNSPSQNDLDSLMATARGICQQFKDDPKLTTHLRGSTLLKAKEYDMACNQACNQDLLKPQPQFGPWKLPYEAASRNFLLCGLQGTGKSTLINILMNSVLPGYVGNPSSNHRALIHDHKGDSAPLMAGMGFNFDNGLLKTLNPFDERACYWDLAKDFDNDVYADILAEILIPINANASQPEFSYAAREVVSGVVKVLNKILFHEWQFHDLIRICYMMTTDRLIEHLELDEENRAIVEILNSQAKETSEGVTFTLRANLAQFKIIASLWAQASEGITVSHFLKHSYILLLGSHSAAEQAVQLVNKLFVTRLLEAFLSEGQVYTSDERNPARTWLILDEGPKVGNLKKLPDALDLGRQMGLSVVFAFHDIPQLKAVYEKLTYSLLAKFHNRYIFKLGDRETKEWASNLFGSAEVLEIVPNLNYSRGANTLNYQTIEGVGNENISHTINFTKRESKLILPSEFGNLPLVSVSGSIQGYLSTVMGQVKVRLPLEDVKQLVPEPSTSIIGKLLVDLQTIRFPTEESEQEFPDNSQDNHKDTNEEEKMSVIIHPYKGVEIPGKGLIKFGMSRQEVRAFFEEEPEEFFKLEDDPLPTDAYEESGIYAYYKEPDSLEALEIFLEARPILMDKSLLEIPMANLLPWIQSLDQNIEIDVDGLDSEKLGLSIYAPDYEDEEDNDPEYTAENVLVFEQGYLEALREELEDLEDEFEDDEDDLEEEEL